MDLYRGTLGISPADAAAGLHWSLSFEDAAYYAARFADPDLTGCIVLHARVPREEIAVFIPGSAHQEVVPAEAPATYEVVTDKAWIGAASARNALRIQALMDAGGWHWAGTAGGAEQVAHEARARMAAAGVPRGAAIVA